MHAERSVQQGVVSLMLDLQNEEGLIRNRIRLYKVAKRGDRQGGIA